ncbi:VTT domain-containing protein [Sedimenticola hydrogenitrophicus]|uniref:VTT domain-containing protein n=1 Tax=Sedimenticola hydrogenitrophicus TaxID=2967975 RepID=UPI0021A95527|nr:VTT domain-containing protein [Sedimenticola hydrogenitrophicus]
MRRATILKPGDNCWRIEHARRAAFLIDGEAYFRALYEAIQRAEHSIYILSWDIDSQVQLIRDPVQDNALPRNLGDFFNTVVKRRKGLHAYVLNWDWAMLYTLEREWLPMYKLVWKTNRRLHFHLDDAYPAGGSQHQKVVVIDDTIAFVGGLDLCKQRWDTTAHRPDDPRRVDSDGKAYPPFHDVQMLVEGDIALALGELARERWHRATGQRLKRVTTAGHSTPWPERVTADLEQVNIAIARTLPAYRQQREVREVERLYLDSIAAAEQFIYIENQYFTSWKLGKALAARLREASGPEVILVLPLMTGGWLEQYTMDVLRGRLIRQLREADPKGRLRIYYADQEGLGNQHICLHSKIMVIDDILLRVASSNLSNRSMGLDSECDLAMEASNDTERSQIAAFRNRLLAEHLGITPDTISTQLEERPSLIAAIEGLQGRPRTLKPLDCRVSELADEMLPEAQIVDPESPLDPEQLADYLLPAEERQPLSRRLLLIGLVLGGLLALAAAWRWTPLGDWLDLETLKQTAKLVKDNPFTPLIVMAIFLLGGLIAIPITLLIVITLITFGSWTGLAYALLGTELSAVLGYLVGAFLGREVVRRFAGASINRISRRLAQHGLLAVITVRVIPVAPFTVINLVAGASHISFRDYLLGTLLGMTPGIIAIALFADRLIAAVRKPDLPDFALLALAVVILLFAALGLKKWLSRPGRASKGPTAQATAEPDD